MTADSTAVAPSRHRDTTPDPGSGGGHQYLAFTLDGKVFSVGEIAEISALAEA